MTAHQKAREVIFWIVACLLLVLQFLALLVGGIYANSLSLVAISVILGALTTMAIKKLCLQLPTDEQMENNSDV